MVLKLINTKHTTFIVDESFDELRSNMGIVFGKAVHLYAKRIPTSANPKGVMHYSNYFSDQAVQICHKDNITLERVANEAENKIYQELSTGQALDDKDRQYLRDNYLED